MRSLLLAALLAGTIAATSAATGPIAAAVAQPANPSFNLVNRAGQAIDELYATPSGVDRWGRDRLAQSFLPAGQTFPVRLPADGTCVYDVRVVYADRKPEERRRLNVCQVESVTFSGGPGSQAPVNVPEQPAGDDPSFRLINRSRAELSELYVSASGNAAWGRDRLGDDIVAAGATRVVRLPHGDCEYDVRVVFANGEASEKRRLNLCTITDVRVP